MRATPPSSGSPSPMSLSARCTVDEVLARSGVPAEISGRQRRHGRNPSAPAAAADGVSISSQFVDDDVVRAVDSTVRKRGLQRDRQVAEITQLREVEHLHAVLVGRIGHNVDVIAVHLHVARIVQRRLHPQHAALLVVHLDRVAIQPVLDPHPFRTPLQIADHFAFEAGRNPVGVDHRRGPATQET